MADFQTIADRIGLPDHMKILLLDPKDDQNVLDSYTALVNPESYSVEHATSHSEDQAIGDIHSVFSFNKIKPETMKIVFLFDSTGSLGKIPFINNQNVLKQINRFLEVAFADAAQTSEPKKLQLVWGPMEFFGLLKSVNISYSHFDSTGIPVRARATCSFSGGKIRFNEKKLPKALFRKKKKEGKKIDFAKEKHAINAVLKYGSYLSIVSLQPQTALPNSLRIASEVAKMII